MNYICHRRFKGESIFGEVNIPALTECESMGGVIYCEGKPICFETSENAHQYFARNNDQNGLIRGKLTQEIQKRLAKRDSHYQNRWDKVWENDICQRYKRNEYDDFWLWNHDFFGASIDDLKDIFALIGGNYEKDIQG